MKRLPLADGKPVILEHRYVIQPHGPRLTKSQAEGSLYRAWTKTHGLNIAGADEVIRAVLLTTAEARHLQAPVRSPALEVSAVGRLDNNAPLWWERTHYRGDQYEIPQPPRPAACFVIGDRWSAVTRHRFGCLAARFGWQIIAAGMRIKI